ncbi:hypothetical protein IFM46972_09758 [Aspergillus udagawae]|uniref:Uncharacterized protein n=1 Tax=Aspergillus udagawae TaxID=91492 RepID=A0A8H3S8C6_9EURO|nr:hypothetical protein IFM46972_09758 [Aspergillus udagawae]
MGGTETLDVLEVPRGRGRYDLVASGHGQLHGVAPHARRAAGDDDGARQAGLAHNVHRGRDSRHVEAQIVRVKEAPRGRPETQPQDTGLFVGDLEPTLGRAVDLLGYGRGASEDSVAYLEPLDVGADLDYFAGNIGAEDEGVFDISSDRRSNELQHPVEGVNGHGGVLDHHLARAGGCVGRVANLERSCLFGGDPGRLIIWSHCDWSEVVDGVK